MIRDPQFWKRFSVAVHQDELEKTTQDPKQSYVSPLPTAPGTPTSQTHLHPTTTLPPMVQLASTRLSFAPSPLSPLSTELSTSQIPKSLNKKPQRPRSKLQKTPSTKPLLRPVISVQETHTSPPQHTLPLPTSPSPSRPHSFFRTPNLSTLSLSHIHLSGRPQSRFNFTTTITADASHRDSWLAGQQRKARQRTWICWCFWIIFLLLVAGIVVTVVVLRAHGII